MHVDEAVQAVKFGRNSTKKALYRYDPDEYHGPMLNYITLAATWFGSAPGKTFAETTRVHLPGSSRDLRRGDGVAALFLLVDGLGCRPTLLAGLFTALSPALSSINRYYIHESLLLFSLWAYRRGLALRPGPQKIGWAILAAFSSTDVRDEGDVLSFHARLWRWLARACYFWKPPSVRQSRIEKSKNSLPAAPVAHADCRTPCPRPLSPSCSSLLSSPIGKA